ncbi:g1284 [Coccomyxa viridis]|uniref:G1284 protein n=1 Tax=Coccomyxa viridis TaxID=1274662 RepID=A0ABP1FJS6_9CHLO
MTLAGRVLRLNRVPGLQGVNTLHTSSRVQMGFGSHGSDNDPDVLDKEKEKNLSGKTKHIHPGLEEGWNEKLASDSEAAVKAERHVDGEATIEDLQHRTVKHIREEHHSEEEVVQDPSKAGASQ